MAKQQWTHVILMMLPATLAEINATAMVSAMNEQHRRERNERGSWANPVNCMAYDTLYRLRKRGVVVRESNGVYRRTER